MHQVLVVSDNEILNQLYVTNLEVYLDAKVTLVDTFSKVKHELSQQSFKLIIGPTSLDELDFAVEMYQYIEAKSLKIPLIIIGQPSRELEGVTLIANSYHLQNLIRASAKVLGVTAKEMALKEVPQFYPIELKFLMKLKEIPCSLYLMMKDGDYIIIGRKGDKIVEHTSKIMNEGVETLFVNSLDRLLVINAISESVVEFLKSTESQDLSAKSQALKLGYDFASTCFTQAPDVKTEIVNLAKACTKVMDEMVNEAPSLKKLLSVLNSQRDGYIYVHSILAAFVSSYMIKRVSWGGDSHIEKINFVLFFHDLMLAPLYQKYPDLKFEEDLIFSDRLGDKEKDLILNHARLAGEAILSYKRAPIGVDLLIKQHHGMMNGIGFAVDYKDDVSPLSKIVLISEAFVEEFLRQKDQSPETQFDVRRIMNKLNEKFKRPTYKKIIESLDHFPSN
jgi:hypothetical protein